MSQAQEKHDEMNQQINETLSVSGSMLVKLFTKEKEENEKMVNTIGNKTINGNVSELNLNTTSNVNSLEKFTT